MRCPVQGTWSERTCRHARVVPGPGISLSLVAGGIVRVSCRDLPKTTQQTLRTEPETGFWQTDA